MNIAMIFAGGVGQRMNTKTMPKQFLELHGKPIIIYTLEQFDNHPEIDGIVISCLEAYIPYLEKLIKKFGIMKVKSIVAGGCTGQDSIYNGIKKIYELFPEDSIVLIHDAVRPIINDELISNNIATVKKYGNAITVAPAIETITIKEDESVEVGEIINRSRCQLAKAPQSFVLKDIIEAHQKAIEENRHDFIDSACIMRNYGHKLYTVEGETDNIKITTPVDFYTFRAIIDAKENSQIFG
ncbi:MAG: 2-C-methyl-D-erythritol 4-phosphate cytidylyltransferase [Lachnospiraceae bacterium]|nr:2-C-methyl-D-erythritol 4-phosphate cytidylyltransferase [Lachnospiraceae bacterium]